MRPETRRRLDQALARERARKFAIAGLVVALIVAIALYADWRRRLSAEDTLVSEADVGGTIEQWHYVSNRQSGPQVISLRVRLDDGRAVEAGSTSHPTAQVGGHIEVTERRYHSGRVAYVWR